MHILWANLSFSLLKLPLSRRSTLPFCAHGSSQLREVSPPPCPRADTILSLALSCSVVAGPHGWLPCQTRPASPATWPCSTHGSACFSKIRTMLLPRPIQNITERVHWTYQRRVARGRSAWISRIHKAESPRRQAQGGLLAISENEIPSLVMCRKGAVMLTIARTSGGLPEMQATFR